MQFGLLKTDAVSLCFWWTQKWWSTIYGNVQASIYEFHILLSTLKDQNYALDTRRVLKFVKPIFFTKNQ